MKIENPNLKWNGKLTPITKRITKIVCHHPAHPSWNIRDIHNYHLKLGWIGIGYNYFITFDGRIYEGRGRNVGAHAQGYNTNTLGVCFQGNFDQQQMTDAQVKAGAWLIAQLIKNEGLTINDVIGHRDINATSCPGKNFRMNDLKQAILEILNPKTKKEEVKVSQNQSVSDWAKDAQKWVKQKGISDGLRPKDPVTREELWTMLWRAAGSPKVK